MILAIPTEAPGGMNGRRSAHFGHCDIFTIVDVSPSSETVDLTTKINEGHEAGGCMSPVMVLKDAGVDAIVVAGLGMKPMQGFNNVGIDVYYADHESTPDVPTVIEKVRNNQLILMHADQACRGSANCQE